MITTLYQVGGAGKASLFSTTQKGGGGRTVWLPKSQFKVLERKGHNKVGTWNEVTLEVQDWIARKKGL